MYQLLPELSNDEYAALKADIAARGVQVPVEYDERGNVLDGYHRVRACQELGIEDWPSIVRSGMTEDEKIDHALSLNLHRRHLSREQRQELVTKLRQQGWSLRRIAGRVGISHEAARKDLRGVNLLTPAVIGADGKQYPAARTVFAPSTESREQAIGLLEMADGGNETAQKAVTALDGGKATITGAYKVVRKSLEKNDRLAAAGDVA